MIPRLDAILFGFLRKYYVFLISSAIFLSTFPSIGQEIRTGLDPSYIWALNYFFTKGIVAGRDVVFSYGPLGFLMFPLPLGNNILISIVFESFFKFIFVYLLLQLGFGIRNKGLSMSKLFVVLLVFAISNFVEFEYVFMFMLPYCVAAAMLLFSESGKKVYMVLGSITLSFSALTMFPNAVGAIFVMTGFFAVYSFNNRLKIRLVLESLILVGITSILFFVLFWFFANNSLGGIGTFLFSRLELAQGNSGAMALDHTDNFVLLVISLISFVAALWSAGDRRSRMLSLMFILPIYAMTKYGFSRADFRHYRHVFDFFVLYFLFFMLYMRKISVLIILFLAVFLGSFFLNIKVTFPEEHFSFVPTLERMIASGGIKNFQTSVLNYSNRKKELLAVSKDNLEPDVLDGTIIEAIGGKSVDIYPWELSIVPANDLTWKGRPIMQSYFANTQKLDIQNALALKKEMPKFMLFERNGWQGEMGSIDWRYLPNDEPTTFWTLMNNYSLVAGDKRVYLLEKAAKPNFGSQQIIGDQEAQWNSWIVVPKHKEGVVLAKIDYKRTFAGIIVKSLWKERVSSIEYKVGGAIKTYRLVVDTMSNGLWIDPKMDTLKIPPTGSQVEAIRIVQPAGYIFHPKLLVRWVFYPYETH